MSSDDQVWLAHEIWVERHRSRELERARWAGRDWGLARRLAEARWDNNPDGTYLWAVLKACEQAHWAHVARRLR